MAFLCIFFLQPGAVPAFATHQFVYFHTRPFFARHLCKLWIDYVLMSAISSRELQHVCKHVCGEHTSHLECRLIKLNCN